MILSDITAAVARAKEGDADALRYLYLRYADNVYGYVCSIVRDEWEAEDVTHHIFAKLLTSLARYEPRVVPFSAWILRVAHNAAVDHVRARRPVPIEDVHPPDAIAPGSGREALADLRLALDTLPAPRTPSTACSTAGAGACATRCARWPPSRGGRARRAA